VKSDKFLDLPDAPDYLEEESKSTEDEVFLCEFRGIYIFQKKFPYHCYLLGVYHWD
jgi:hypothetical protein